MSKATRERRRQDNGIVPVTVVPPAPLLRLDLGCGPSPREGFEGVDRLPFDGKVKHVLDLAERLYHESSVFKPWPWPDAGVEEAHSSHFVEHLTAPERVHFFNELYRVLVPGGKAMIIVPNWSSCRAYGDPTHQWPPMGVFFFHYLYRAWRLANAPHTDREHWPEGYSCDFDWGAVYSVTPAIAARSEEARAFALAHYIEAAEDLHVTLTKTPRT